MRTYPAGKIARIFPTSDLAGGAAPRTAGGAGNAIAAGAILGLLLCFLAGCVTEPEQRPPNASEFYGMGSVIEGSPERLRGPEIYVDLVDGQKVYPSDSGHGWVVSPGLHRITLGIARLDLEARPTIDFLVGENRKYQFTVRLWGVAEFVVTARDITTVPEEIVFVARATRAGDNSRVTYVKPPPYLAVPAVLSTTSPDGRKVPFGKAYGNMDTPPVASMQVMAEYPSELKKQGIQGAAVVKFTLTAKGEMKDFSVEADRPEFGEAALAAAKRSQFLPARQGRRRVECRMELLYAFPGPWAGAPKAER